MAYTLQILGFQVPNGEPDGDATLTVSGTSITWRTRGAKPTLPAALAGRMWVYRAEHAASYHVLWLILALQEGPTASSITPMTLARPGVTTLSSIDGAPSLAMSVSLEMTSALAVGAAKAAVELNRGAIGL